MGSLHESPGSPACRTAPARSRRGRILARALPRVALLCALAGAAAAATPWSEAIRRGDLEALHARVDSVRDVDAPGPRGKTALMLASSRDDGALIARLLARGAAVDRRNDAGGTALLYAAQYGHDAAVRALLDAGADVNLTAAKGWTALMIAVLKGHAGVVDLLLSRGADPDAADMHGWSPLMRAIEAGHVDVARGLVETAGTRLDVASTDGLTALHVAALRGQAEITRLLLAHGADAAARDDEGHTPLTVAKRRGHAEVAEILRAHSAR